MTRVYNLGSINVDRTISVARFPRPGETIPGEDPSVGLGGKGLNISVALLRAGQAVCHIGAVHQDDHQTRDQIAALGLSTEALESSRHSTGQAFILLDDCKENAIVVSAGANRRISDAHIDKYLTQAGAGDWLVFQNETNNQEYALDLAKSKGMKVGLVPAPFDPKMVDALTSRLDLIVLNEIEAEQLEKSTGASITDLGVPLVVVTKGALGATLFRGGQSIHTKSLPVSPVDTTAAGDTFFGFFLSAILSDMSDREAMFQANAAAALSVQKMGATASIPTLHEVIEFQQ